MFKKEIASFYKKKHRKQRQLLFWPNLAKAQYAKLVISWLDANLAKNGELVYLKVPTL